MSLPTVDIDIADNLISNPELMAFQVTSSSVSGGVQKDILLQPVKRAHGDKSVQERLIREGW